MSLVYFMYLKYLQAFCIIYIFALNLTKKDNKQLPYSFTLL